MGLARMELAAAWREVANLKRADIFGYADPLRPISNAQDIDTPAIGCVGTSYRPGGTVFLSVNPAGGADGRFADVGDREMYDHFRSVGSASESELLGLFEISNQKMVDEMPKWRIYKQYIGGVLDALGRDRSQIAYLYVVPFRTRGDKAALIKESVWRRGAALSLCKRLKLLQPSVIVAYDRISEAVGRAYAAVQPGVRVWYFTRKRDAHAERASILAAMTAGQSQSIK